MAQDPYREIGCPQAAAALAAELVARHDDDREHFWVIFLNARNHYQGHHEVAMGSLSACMVEPREVLGPCLREGAAQLIVVHNHPSSDPTPSGEDIRLTRTLAEARDAARAAAPRPRDRRQRHAHLGLARRARAHVSGWTRDAPGH